MIDDDEDDQEIFNLAIEEFSQNISCTAISDARIAMKILENKELYPDVIFLDLNMPVMNGQQFLKEIKQKDELKEIPVIIFSTSFHDATIDSTIQLGATNFVTKPGSVNELVTILKPLLF